MMLEDVLRKAFALAHQRIGIIFLDLLWKAVWLIGTLAALFLIGAWLGSAVQAIGWEDTGASAVNGSIAAAVLKELWNAYKAETVWMLTAVLLLSAFGWLFLEAFFRARFCRKHNPVEAAAQRLAIQSQLSPSARAPSSAHSVSSEISLGPSEV